jgi:NAD(P)-dependent dehydrogenase (short-subunit alcohol dehydrogenase family)
VERFSEELANKKIRVDILINNAARNPKVSNKTDFVKSQRLETLDMEEWFDDLHVGLTGPLLMSKVFGGLMAVDGKGGVIINIASDLSVIAPDQRLYSIEGSKDNEQPVKPVSYSVVKTGLVGLTRYLATYWADKNVRVNALSPGGVFENQPSEFVSRVQNLIPMGRMADRSEYRGAIQFLCSDASSYMTGHNLIIDGGRSIW